MGGQYSVGYRRCVVEVAPGGVWVGDSERGDIWANEV